MSETSSSMFVFGDKRSQKGRFSFLLLIGFIFLFNSVTATVVINEDFEAGTLPDLWTNTNYAGTGVWAFRDAGPVVGSSGNGYAVYTGSALAGGDNAALITDYFSTFGLTCLSLSFDHCNNHVSGLVRSVQYRIGSGAWITLASYTSNDGNALVTPLVLESEVVDLSPILNQSSVQLRFLYAEPAGTLGNSWYVDNVLVHSSPDISVQEIVAPGPGACGSPFGNETITLRIRNDGAFAYTGTIPLRFYVDPDNAAPTIVNHNYIASSWAPGTTTLVTFSGTAPMGGTTEFILKAYSALAADCNRSNDTITETRTAPLLPPFIETFETLPSAAWSIDNVPSVWTRGAFPYLGGAEGKGLSWYLNSTYNGQLTSIYSPIVDLSSTNDPVLSFDMKFSSVTGFLSEQYYIQVQYDNFDGNGWRQLGDYTSPSWYSEMPNPTSFFINNPGWGNGTLGSWTHMEQRLCDFALSGCIQFRILVDLSTASSEDFAFDNFAIRDDSDPGLVDFTAPVISCAYGSSETLALDMYNWGCSDLTGNVTIRTVVSGPIPDTFDETVNVGTWADGTILSYTFTNTLDLSTPGTYTVKSYITSLNSHRENDTIVQVINANSSYVNTYPYTEDFNLNDGGWTTDQQNAVSYWTHGTLGAGYLGGPQGEGDSWYLENSGVTPYDAWLYTPSFDFSSISNPKMIFDVKMALGVVVNDRTVRVEESHDGGTTWNTIGTNTDPYWYSISPNSGSDGWGNGTIANWSQVQLSLCDFKGNSCQRFRITGGRNYSGDLFAVDNFQLIEDSLDVGIIGLTSLSGSSNACDASNNQPIIVDVFNYTCDTIDPGVPVVAEVVGPNGLNYSTPTVTTQPIPPYESITVVMPGTFDMSPAGTYDFTIYTDLATDNNRENDTARTSITIEQLLYTGTFPYVETFNADSGNWTLGDEVGMDTTEAKWAYGISPYLSGSTTNCWYTLHKGGGTSIATYLETPVFTFDQADEIQISFNLMMHDDATNPHFLALEYSLNGGNSWSVLGTNSDASWYGVAPEGLSNGWGDGTVDPWQRVSYTMEDMCGTTCLTFRFVAYGINNNTDVNFSIDSFYVDLDGADDLEALLITGPESGDCDALGANEYPTIFIKNNGCQTISSVPLEFNLTGAGTASFTQTLVGSIASGETREFTFSGANSIDLSVAGTYYLEAIIRDDLSAGAINDTFPANDTIKSVRYISDSPTSAIRTFPYTADFEANDGGWVSRDFSLSNTYFYRDSLPYLNGSQGNGKSWYLVQGGPNLLLVFPILTDAYLYSPVFDFSETTNPTFSMDLKFSAITTPLTPNLLKVEYQLNGGSWTRLGDFDDTDWYSIAPHSSDTGFGDNFLSTWNNVSKSLCELSGDSCVRFRIAAEDTYFGTMMAVDNISISAGQNDSLSIKIASNIPASANCSGFSANESYAVVIRNHTCRPIKNIPFTLEITPPIGVPYTATGVIVGPVAGESQDFETISGLSPVLNMTTSGEYTFKAYIDATNPSATGLSKYVDTYTRKDTIYESRYSNVISTYPFIADFDTTSDGFVSNHSTANVFPKMFILDTIPTTIMGGSGGYGRSWYIEAIDQASTPEYNDPDLTPFENPRNLWIESPNFDLTSINNPLLQFDMKMQMVHDGCNNYGRIEYSIGGGAWQILGGNAAGYADPNWYNFNMNQNWFFTWYDCSSNALLGHPWEGRGWGDGTYNTWQHFNRSLCDIKTLGGSNCVKFRFYAGHQKGTNTFAFDNFKIIEGADIQMVSVLDPVTSDNCELSSNQEFRIRVRNNGCANVTNVPVVLQISGPLNFTFRDTIAGPLVPGVDFDYLMDTVVDMSTFGTYNLTFYTNQSGDVVTSNDTISFNRIVDQYRIESYPSYTTFNGTEYGWYGIPGHALRAYFTHGPVSSDYPIGPMGRVDSWYIAGDSSNTSYTPELVSNVYDLSSLTNPTLSFDILSDQKGTTGLEGFRILKSVNGGLFTTLRNWDVTEYSDWTNIQEDLCGELGETCIRFKFEVRVKNKDRLAIDNFLITDNTTDISLISASFCKQNQTAFALELNNEDVLCSGTGPAISSYTFTYVVNSDTVTQTQTLGTPIPYDASGYDTVSIPYYIEDADFVKMWVSLPNGIIDPNNGNDTLLPNLDNVPYCHDNCIQAVEVGIGTVNTSTTAGATENQGEDFQLEDCSPFSTSTDGTIWYTFTTDNSGDTVFIDFENFNCSPDPTKGIEVVLLEVIGTPCDTNGWKEIICFTNPTATEYHYDSVLPTNTTYYLMIDGQSGNNCEFEMSFYGGVRHYDLDLGPDLFLCTGDTAILNAGIGENGAVFSWNEGALVINDSLLDSITVSGEYRVEVTYDGQVLRDTINITFSSLSAVTITADTSICEGDSIWLVASGAVAYDWGGGNINDSLLIFSSGLDSTYVLNFGSGTCTGDTSLLVQEKQKPILTTTPNDTICLGDVATVIASSLGSGTFSWNNGDMGTTTLIGSAVAMDSVLIVSLDSGGCINRDTVIVSIQNPPTASVNISDSSYCQGDSVNLITTAGASYQWSSINPMPFDTIAYSNSVWVHPMDTTTYELIAYIGTCEDRDTVTINFVPYQAPSIVLSDTITCTTDSIKMTSVGLGTFNWSTGSTLDSTYALSSVEVTDDLFILTVSNDICIRTDSVYIDFVAAPVASYNYVTDSIAYCQGDSVLLKADSGTNYQWTIIDPLPFDTISYNDSFYVSPVVTTTYELIARSGSCEDRDTIKVGYLSFTPITISMVGLGDNDTVCGADSITLQAFGTGDFSWIAPFVTPQDTDSIKIGPAIGVQVYTVTSSYESTCFDTASFVTNRIDVLADASLNPTTPYCEGQSITLTAAGMALTYTWIDSALSLVSTGSNYTIPSISDTGLIMYQLIANNAFCRDTDSITIQVTPFTAPVITTPPTSICIGDSINLQGTGVLNLDWTNADNGDSIYVQPSTTTTYKLYASNLTCIDSAAVTITVLIPPSKVVSSPQVLCGNRSLILDASASGASVYEWRDLSGGVLASTSTFDVSSFTTSDTLIYWISNGCSDSDTVVVNFIDFTAPTISGTTPVCEGDEILLEASGTVVGTTFEWIKNTTTISLDDSLKELIDSTSIYSLITELIDSNGTCSDTSIYVVSVLNYPVLSLSDGGFVCAGTDSVGVIDTIIVRSNIPGVDYSWRNSTGSDPNTVIYTNDTLEYVAIMKDESFEVTATVGGLCTTIDTISYQLFYNPWVGDVEEGAIYEAGTILHLNDSDNVKYIWEPSHAEMISCDNCANPEIITSETDSATITVITDEGCFSSVTFAILNKYVRPYVPNAFSPNGDGLHDLFRVRGMGLDKFNFHIYNRWGQEVYNSRDIDDEWDGTFKGKPLNTGVFVYYLEYSLIGSSTEEFLKGNITLVR